MMLTEDEQQQQRGLRLCVAPDGCRQTWQEFRVYGVQSTEGVLTVVEDGRGRVGSRGAGGPPARAPRAPHGHLNPHHVDLLLVLHPLRPRVGLPLLGHQAARHGAAGGLNASGN